MFDRPEIMRLARDMAAHASARQAEIARNVANADTPGYRAREVIPFSEIVSRMSIPDLRTSRPGHLATAPSGTAPLRVIEGRTEPSPNGNSVSIETEMLKQAEVRHQHDTALAVYKSALDLMRSAIGRAR